MVIVQRFIDSAPMRVRNGHVRRKKAVPELGDQVQAIGRGKLRDFVSGKCSCHCLIVNPAVTAQRDRLNEKGPPKTAALKWPAEAGPHTETAFVLGAQKLFEF